MDKNFQYVVVSISLMTIVCMILIYLANIDKTSNFVSFNDGSIECITIEVKRGMNKEELAMALKLGANYVTGKIGNTPGCVNYEFN